MYREGGQVEFVVMHVRQGKLLGNRSFSARGMELPDPEVLGSFLLAYYDDAPLIPDELILPSPLVEDDEAPLKAWLRETSGRKVAVVVPERGDRKKLLALAQKNAASCFATRRNRQEDSDQALLSLKQRLGLSKLPRTIECYDISHIQGSDTVASMVVFVDGAAARKRYRSFRIRGGSEGLAQGNRQNDDFASMAEVLGRRLRRGLVVATGGKGPEQEDEGSEPADTWALPDLIVIDGGKGQLGRVLAMMRDLGITVGAGGVDVVSLAKERKVEIGRGKSALEQLREHRAKMRANPRKGVLRAEDAGADPSAAQRYVAAARAEMANGPMMNAAAAPEVGPAGTSEVSEASRAGHDASDASDASDATVSSAEAADAAATSEVASPFGLSGAAGADPLASPQTDDPAIGELEGPDAQAVVRPGETYQDYVLSAEETDDGDAEVRPERVFVPGAKEAIRLRPGTSELFLMTQIRTRRTASRSRITASVAASGRCTARSTTSPESGRPSRRRCCRRSARSRGSPRPTTPRSRRSRASDRRW